MYVHFFARYVPFLLSCILLGKKSYAVENNNLFVPSAKMRFVQISAAYCFGKTSRKKVKKYGAKPCGDVGQAATWGVRCPNKSL
jgi:hypothetical protein